MMYRKITQYLLDWKKSSYRRPLILQGARQVGKTYALLEFGKAHYENVAYFNFETNPSLANAFEAVSYTHLVTTGTTERNLVMLFKRYENVEELNRRVLMSLVDRILIHENHAIEIVFKYKDEYQQTLEYVLGYADELDIAV